MNLRLNIGFWCKNQRQNFCSIFLIPPKLEENWLADQLLANGIDYNPVYMILEELGLGIE